MDDSRPIRVCLVPSRYPPDFSGHGIQLQRTLPHYAAEGVEISVLTLEPAEGVSWPTDDTVPVHRILPLGGSLSARLARIRKLRRHFREHAGRYDLVHGALSDWEFYLAMPLFRRLGLPVIFEMILLGSDDPISLRRRRLGWLTLRLLRDADAWVGISEPFRERLIAADLDATRFHHVYTAVDVDRYHPLAPDVRLAERERLKIPAEAQVAISVGGLLPRKGMDRLIAAWARLSPRAGRHLLLIVGPATEREGLRPQYLPHVRALHEQVASLGVTDTVRFVGRADDVERWMGVSDLFVFLSHREGLGTVTAEAMATGLPCVVAPMDGIGREVVAEGRTGLVVDEADDPEVVAAAMRSLFADPAKLRRMGAAGRIAAQTRFSMRSRAKRLAELYRELVRARRGSDR